MAAEIKETLGLDSTLIEGSGGIFDVKCESDLVYSKQQNDNQFPNHQSVIDLLQVRKSN